jgi:hypothetical protein
VINFVAIAVAAQILADRPAEIIGSHKDQAAYRDMLTKAAIAAEAFFSLAPICSTAAVSDVSTKVFNIPGQSPDYVSEVAFESVTVAGCGRRTVVNLQVTARRDGQGWMVQQKVPGEGHADFRLQQLAMAGIGAELKNAAPKGCDAPSPGKNLQIGETKIYMPKGHVFFSKTGKTPKLPIPGVDGLIQVITPGDPEDVDDLNAPLAWTELWPIKACGTDRSFLVTFAPKRSRPDMFEVSTSPHWPGSYQVP